MIIILLSLIIIFCIIIIFAKYFNRIRSILTLKKITNYKDGCNIYTMEIKYDYDIQHVIDYGIKTTQDFVDAVVKESLPFLKVKIKLPSFACSSYKAYTDNAKVVMGRNYDFKIDTSALIVKTSPKNGYKSISCIALSNINANDPLKNLKTKFATLTAPFSVVDGINEKGVSIAILIVDTDSTNQKTGKEKVTGPLIMRIVLDKAATTEEAVTIFKKYDMLAINGRDFHFFVSDSRGDSRIIDYDPLSEDRKIIVTPINAITNFYSMHIDKVLPYQNNGIYGHGRERYDKMKKILDENDGILSYEKYWEVLKAASSAPNPKELTHNTQWSIIFNNTDKTAEITLRRHWGETYKFSVV